MCLNVFFIIFFFFIIYIMIIVIRKRKYLSFNLLIFFFHELLTWVQFQRDSLQPDFHFLLCVLIFWPYSWSHFVGTVYRLCYSFSISLVGEFRATVHHINMYHMYLYSEQWCRHTFLFLRFHLQKMLASIQTRSFFLFSFYSGFTYIFLVLSRP